MNHCKSACPNNPKSTKYKSEHLAEETVALETASSKRQLTEEQLLSEKKNLDKIISEGSASKMRPAIVRMVEHFLDDKEKSIKVLYEALRLADIDLSQRKIIVRNWASHLEVDDFDEMLKKERKIDAEEEKKEDKKKTPVEKLKEGIKKAYDGELEQLEIMRVRKQIANMERELSGEEKKEEKKLVHIIDGVSLDVTPQEKMAWMRYEDDRKKQEEEREERKAERKRQEEDRRNRESDVKTHKGDELVEWVLGEGKDAKTIKVRPETIPMLIQSQGKKGGESDELKILREEIKLMREQHQQFQTNVLHREIEELKVAQSVDPIDRLFESKDKLEKLGIVSSNKATAMEQMYSMDRKKMETMLTIALDKSRSVEHKVDHLVDALGPLAKEYVREAVVTMRQQRGATAPEETRKDEDYERAADELEKIEKSMPDTTVEPPQKKTLSIEPTKKTKTKKTEGG